MQGPKSAESVKARGHTGCTGSRRGEHHKQVRGHRPGKEDMITN